MQCSRWRSQYASCRCELAHPCTPCERKQGTSGRADVYGYLLSHQQLHIGSTRRVASSLGELLRSRGGAARQCRSRSAHELLKGLFLATSRKLTTGLSSSFDVTVLESAPAPESRYCSTRKPHVSFCMPSPFVPCSLECCSRLTYISRLSCDF
jgi:hypothetical protein